MSIKLINNIIRERFYIIELIVLLLFIIIFIKLFNINIIKNEKYKNLLYEKTSRSYVSKEGERGKIYDRNGKLLVGNTKVFTLVYYKNSETTLYNELKMAKLISKNIKLKYNNQSIESLKNYYLIINKEKLIKKLDSSITKKYKEDKITHEEYLSYLKNFITEEDLNNLTEEEKRISYIYNLMNEGYKYAYKAIKINITKEEIDYINKNKEELTNFEISYIYERYYPYKNVFRDYLGDIGKIQYEELNDMLEKGYSMDDVVGISYIEKEYESYLKAEDEKYIMTASGDKKIISETKSGKDIYLSIDIDLQIKIEKIIYDNIIKAKKNNKSTKYYNRSYALISDASTGEILASAGIGVINKQNKYEKINYLTDLSTMSVTPGSIVKAASHLVGYENNFIKFGYTVNDSCIKVKNTPSKCSWRRLGKVDDLKALKYSSNYYQYLIAIKVGGGKYNYNNSLVLNSDGFKTYRNMYNQFGLGVKTGIDLPYESIGYVGNDKNTGSLLDFPIGQYDTYTPLQILQYINTVAASGERNSLHYLKLVKEKNKIIYEYNKNTKNNVRVNKKNMDRVRLGLKMVMESGRTGSGYVDKKYKTSGKTGTAESFSDTNLDGEIDTKTITKTFGSYVKFNNKIISIVVISPNVSANTSSISGVNKKISRNISDFYFQNYK